MIVDIGFSIDFDLPENWDDLDEDIKANWLCEKAYEMIRKGEITDNDFIIHNCDDEPDLVT